MQRDETDGSDAAPAHPASKLRDEWAAAVIRPRTSPENRPVLETIARSASPTRGSGQAELLEAAAGHASGDGTAPEDEATYAPADGVAPVPPPSGSSPGAGQRPDATSTGWPIHQAGPVSGPLTIPAPSIPPTAVPVPASPVPSLPMPADGRALAHHAPPAPEEDGYAEVDEDVNEDLDEVEEADEEWQGGGALTGMPESGPEWEHQIAKLLRRPENLRSVYQPIVELCTGECVGYEALTRVAEWPASSPEPWFQAAMRTGLAAQLEAAALVTSLRGRADLAAHRFLSVNVAPATLSNPVVAGVLQEQHDLRGLVVDLTDITPVLTDNPHTRTLQQLRDRGLMVAANLASCDITELERIRAVKPDLIKVHRDIVKGVHTDNLRERVVKLIVSIAADFGAAVQAVGVEALEDARLLQFIGVRMAQGWLFGRARPGFLPPSAEVTAWLKASWEETVTLTRVGRLAVPVARLSDLETVSGSHGWLADCDDDGRLRRLVRPRPDGNPPVTVAASQILRLRASQDLPSAARRMLLAGSARRPHGLLSVVDEEGRFVGLADAEQLLREVVDPPEG